MPDRPTSDRNSVARRLAHLLGVFHNVTYYAPEMKAFADLGLPEYWRAYMAYRSAPMGIVAPAVIEATFYNFAPSVVAEAIPSAWETTTIDEVLHLRDRSIKAALQRTLDAGATNELDEAATLALAAITDCEAGARPLFGAHRDMPVPTSPLMRLWWACTLWREHRGDDHNIALAAAGIDGIECHVLLSAKGVGNRDIIKKIRGWSDAQWDAAQTRLVERALLHEDGSFTDAGRLLRGDIESHTDELASAPRLALGEDNANRLIEIMEPQVEVLISSGLVPGRWPPKATPA